MQINVEAKLFMPALLLWHDASNLPVAEFRGGIFRPEDIRSSEFDRLVQGKFQLPNCELSIVRYEAEYWTLVLRGYIPGKSIVDAKKFIATHVEPWPHWIVDHQVLARYEKRCQATK